MNTLIVLLVDSSQDKIFEDAERSLIKRRMA